MAEAIGKVRVKHPPGAGIVEDKGPKDIPRGELAARFLVNCLEFAVKLGLACLPAPGLFGREVEVA